MLTVDEARKKATMVKDLEVYKLMYKIENEICKNCSKGYFYAVVFPHVLLAKEHQEKIKNHFEKQGFKIRMTWKMIEIIW